MATVTEYLGLTKPELSDNLTPTIFAENFDIIDKAIEEGGMRDEEKAQLQAIYDKVVTIPNVNLIHNGRIVNGTFSLASNVELVVASAWSEGTTPIFTCTSDTAEVEQLCVETAAHTRYAAFLVKGEIGNEVNFNCSYVGGGTSGTFTGFMRFGIN